MTTFYRTATKAALRILASFLLTLAWIAPTSADTKLIVEEYARIDLPTADAPPRETTELVTLWYGDNELARVSGDQRMVLNLDKDETYMIDDAARTVHVLKHQPKSAATQATATATGETRDVGQWAASRYDLSIELAPGDAGSMKVWVSTDLDMDLDTYQRLAKQMYQAAGMDALAELPGYPVMIESDFGFIKTSSTVQSVESATPPAGTYEIPTTYQRR